MLMKGQLHFFADNQFGENVQNRCNLLSLLSDRVKFSDHPRVSPMSHKGQWFCQSPTHCRGRPCASPMPREGQWIVSDTPDNRLRYVLQFARRGLPVRTARTDSSHGANCESARRELFRTPKTFQSHPAHAFKKTTTDFADYTDFVAYYIG